MMRVSLGWKSISIMTIVSCNNYSQQFYYMNGHKDFTVVGKLRNKKSFLPDAAAMKKDFQSCVKFQSRCS